MRLVSLRGIRAVATSQLLDDRFLPLEALGRGGMATVYRAFDRVEQRLVALKVLDERTAAGRSHPLSAEFECWSRLRHPNIVRAHELARAERGPLPCGTPYLVLEHFPGHPAHRALEVGRASPDRLSALAHDILDALAHVHAAGLVHRDLKPGNVLVRVSPRGRPRVKLTDFGLAARTGHSDEPGFLSGSIPYVAPEGILGQPLDGRADLYGLGILLFYLACGEMPFPGRDPGRIVRWHLGNARPDPRATAPHVPDRLARFVARLMARDRGERPASAVEALRLLAEGEPGRPAPHRSAAGRADRARLRLALDGARAGGARAIRLPSSRAAAEELLQDLAARAQIQGLAVHRLERGDRRGRSSLGRIVLRLLLARGGEVGALVARHGLERGLPLGLFGGLPVWDRMCRGAEAASLDPAARRTTAAGVAAFLLESGARQPMVLVVRREAERDPLAREVVEILKDKGEGTGPWATRASGILLVLESAAAARGGVPEPARGGRLTRTREAQEDGRAQAQDRGSQGTLGA